MGDGTARGHGVSQPCHNASYTTNGAELLLLSGR